MKHYAPVWDVKYGYYFFGGRYVRRSRKGWAHRNGIAGPYRRDRQLHASPLANRLLQLPGINLSRRWVT